MLRSTSCFPFLLSTLRVLIQSLIDTLIFKSMHRVLCETVMEMPIKFEVSVMQVGSSLRITVPKQVAAHLGIKKGDMVTLYSDNSHIIMEKKVEK